MARARLRARWWQRVKAWLLWEPFRPIVYTIDHENYCRTCRGTCIGRLTAEVMRREDLLAGNS